MHPISMRRIESKERSRSKLLMVAVGIVLFVVGFMLTVAAIPQTEQTEISGSSGSANGDDLGSSSGFYLMSGMFVSLTGVVLATVGPAMAFVRRTSRD